MPDWPRLRRLHAVNPAKPKLKPTKTEQEGGPRLFAAYLSVDRVHDEGITETMGNGPSRHCYTKAIEVPAHEHQPRIGELVNVSLVVKGHWVLMVRTRIRSPKIGPTLRKRDGTLLSLENLPYEKAFGCLKDLVVVTQRYEHLQVHGTLLGSSWRPRLSTRHSQLRSGSGRSQLDASKIVTPNAVDRRARFDPGSVQAMYERTLRGST